MELYRRWAIIAQNRFETFLHPQQTSDLGDIAHQREEFPPSLLKHAVVLVLAEELLSHAVCREACVGAYQIHLPGPFDSLRVGDTRVAQRHPRFEVERK